jgi:KUP system potassium uptake protein
VRSSAGSWPSGSRCSRFSASSASSATRRIYGARFFLENGFPGFLVLGSVFLVVTGGEALYADMGHFGRKPIALGWFFYVLPALLLNYYGQGGLLLERPEAIENPFYLLAPSWATIPLAVLATCATVIASQALISGAFSLTLQAVQLGYLPRVKITQTSEEEVGQVYIASVNRILMVACVGLVLGFRTSSNLAAAYGVAVTATMVVTTLLFYVVARERFGWSRLQAGALCALFAVFDLSFFGANLFKIPDGGWFPLVVGAIVFTVMTTWKHGRELVIDAMHAGEMDLDRLVGSMNQTVERLHGTAVYLYSRAGKAPPALLSNLQHQGALHERVLCVTVQQAQRLHVPPPERIALESHDKGFAQVVLSYGYRDEICVPDALETIAGEDVVLDLDHATYIVGRERVLATEGPGMALWRERLFAVMLRNSTNIVSFFNLPNDRVVEVGRAIEI